MADVTTVSPSDAFARRSLVYGKQVHEIGCGVGTHAEMLIRNDAQVTAVDQTTFALRSTHRRRDWLANAILRRFGSMIVIDAVCS
jgi:2-polyprenyl-3-methyl-5-hydroxy-6-metoxy-1,4-benzoquinol methylase